MFSGDRHARPQRLGSGSGALSGSAAPLRASRDPRKTVGPGSCPFTALYWSFLEQHERKLAHVQRMRMPLRAMLKRSAEDRARLHERAEAAIGQLERGEDVT